MTSVRRGCRAHAALGLLAGLLLCSQGSAQPEGCPEPFATDLRDYKAFHAQMRTHPDAKYLIWRCPPEHDCQGVGNRARGMLWMLRVAVAFRRVMLIYWGQPAPLTTFLLPNEVNWTVDGFDHEFYMGKNTIDEMIYYDSIYRANQEAQAVFNNTKVYRANTNEFMEVHMANITDVTDPRTLPLDADWSPYFAVGACLWNFLFKPSPEVEQRAVAHIQQLYGSYPVDYVAWHWRHGDADVRGQPTIKIPELGIMLACAYNLSRTSAGLDPNHRPITLVTDFNELRKLVVAGHFRGLAAPNITAVHVEREPGIQHLIHRPADTAISIFVDLYILAKARCIVHSDSTFSHTAVWWGGPRLVACRKDVRTCNQFVNW